jgi:predicted dehydrogenase
MRIGILGAAGIAPNAIINPARVVDGAEIVAVAARDLGKASEYAAEHGIQKSYGSYDELLADPDIDLVYNPSPNGLHGRWTIAAVQAGKHVLCEKPFTADADEAREVAGVVAATDRVVVEAFHYRYHPAMLRTIEIVKSGEIGDLVSVESAFVVAGPPRDDIRWDWSLAGGSLMDVGCYPVHFVRSIVGTEPTVISASATAIDTDPEIDGELSIELSFGGGITGLVRSSMVAGTNEVYSTIVGTLGSIEVVNPFLPQQGSTITVQVGDVHRIETPTSEASYNFQLRAVIDTIVNGTPSLTGTADAIANMEVIDAAYVAAGMQKRHPTA